MNAKLCLETIQQQIATIRGSCSTTGITSQLEIELRFKLHKRVWNLKEMLERLNEVPWLCRAEEEQNSVDFSYNQYKRKLAFNSDNSLKSEMVILKRGLKKFIMPLNRDGNVVFNLKKYAVNENHCLVSISREIKVPYECLTQECSNVRMKQRICYESSCWRIDITLVKTGISFSCATASPIAVEVEIECINWKLATVEPAITQFTQLVNFFSNTDDITIHTDSNN